MEQEGLGCPALIQLAASGIGKIGIVDGDSIELSNLPRQALYTASDINLNKAKIAASKLEQINPHISTKAYPCYLNDENAPTLLEPYELVIDGTDQSLSRYLIAKWCEKLG